MRDEYCQTLLSHGQPKEVVSATDSSFRHSPPEKSELTPPPMSYTIYYLQALKRRVETNFDFMRLESCTQWGTRALLLGLFSHM